MKLVIEQKQRDRRKRGEEIEDPFLPLWFQYDFTSFFGDSTIPGGCVVN